MSLYVPVPSGGIVSVGICDRCHRKVPYSELRADGNSPGLRVCQDPGCWDVKDPYKYPSRVTENITLKYPRPDEPLE